MITELVSGGMVAGLYLVKNSCIRSSMDVCNTGLYKIPVIRISSDKALIRLRSKPKDRRNDNIVDFLGRKDASTYTSGRAGGREAVLRVSCHTNSSGLQS